MSIAGATRIGDDDILHCSVPIRQGGFLNVLVNKKPWSCQGHTNYLHFIPCGINCCVHKAPIGLGSTTVRVYKRGAGSQGDWIKGCTFTAKGSLNVFIGP